MTADQDQPRTPKQTPASREQCAGCAATLLADQRYCLRCGERRGRPRIDFTAFWGPLSPTDPARGSQEAHRATGAGRQLLPGASTPSRRLTGALAALVLAASIVAGAALGPSTPNSPADASALAQRALAVLVAQAGGDSHASAPTGTATSSTATSGESEAAPASAPVHKAKAALQTASTTAAPESEPSSAPPSEGSSSKGSSSEGSSSKGSGESEKTAPGTPVKLPPIKHVWLIALSGVSLDAALKDPTADPYLAKELASKGTLLSDYTLSAPSALGNGIALLAGQGVNLDTEQNCPSYVELQPPTISAANGLAEGVGCVYPAAVKTLADELTAGGLTWKAYVQDMEEGAPSAAESPAGASETSASGTSSTSSAETPSGTSSTPDTAVPAPTPDTSSTPSSGVQATGEVTCRHPEAGAADPNQTPVAGDPYLTFRNPFVYFDSLLSSGACASDDVDLGQLQSGLTTPADTPSFSWIVPSACDDGAAIPCARGAAAGLGPVDAFLKEVVGEILATAAYREGGLIAIVPDGPPGATAPSGSPGSDSSTAPTSATTPVGALLLSPFVHSKARVSEAFNDFSLLKSLTQLFGVLPLGHANDPGTVSFGATVYSTTEKAAQAASRPRRQTTPHAGG